MELKVLVLVSAMGLACAATIQDPYIHDSVEDQIAMESGARRSVVAPPPHLVEGDADSEEEADTVPADDAAADAPAADDDEAPSTPEEEEEEAETGKPSAVPDDSFAILLNDEPERPQPAQYGQTFGGFALTQPARPSFQRPQASLLSLLSRMQYPSLGAYGSPVVVLQPIFVAVPMEPHAADGEKPAGGQSQEPPLFRRQPVRRQPNVNLMDLIQRGYFAY
ncbi:uncharacterized protein LOC119099679 [Pollicipes pollicipes]|uniref:uncharacterized protein LOC119099679 n=1 Tax=Pollicipes pollicipes TaxID=41117 RepID=UPI001884D24D|nr:uncharacterized protein LOC119099679 [Pollicipes pollicipes]